MWHSYYATSNRCLEPEHAKIQTCIVGFGLTKVGEALLADGFVSVIKAADTDKGTKAEVSGSVGASGRRLGG